MPVTQRDQDIMELESQLRIKRILQEWQQGFMGDRSSDQQPELSQDQPEFSQEIENDDSVLSGGGR